MLTVSGQTAALQRNGVRAFHMAWRMTASLRATATFAFLNPAIFASRNPQALSEENFPSRVSSAFAASNRCFRVSLLPRFEMRPLRLISPDS